MRGLAVFLPLLGCAVLTVAGGGPWFMVGGSQ